MDVCKKREPALLDAGKGHYVACYAAIPPEGS
jgi:hypothetical protein